MQEPHHCDLVDVDRFQQALDGLSRVPLPTTTPPLFKDNLVVRAVVPGEREHNETGSDQASAEF